MKLYPLAMAALLVSAGAAHADEQFVRCEYDLPATSKSHALHQSVITEKSDAARWLALMRKDGDKTAACHALDQSPVYHFLSQSEGGKISLLSNLTEDQCETIKHDLEPGVSICGNGAGCSWIVQDGDIKWSKCFK